MLKNKNILLCLCGGIAVYKCVALASKLTKAGAVVKTVMTNNAMEFVSPLTFKSITKQSVSYKLFNNDAPIEHISLAEWADIFVIVPATANIIGKIANGIADDLLTTTVMATRSPVLIIPAMNSNMLNNAIVQENIEKLKRYKYSFLEPDTGNLACDITADNSQNQHNKGRLPNISEIIYAIKTKLYYNNDLQDKKVLITVGACIEKIDQMRYISNFSSGKMGVSLARAIYLRGANVSIIHADIKVKLPYYVKAIQALSAEEMYKNVVKQANKNDIIIMTAAVSDYKPENEIMHKIKKGNDLELSLKETTDILHYLGKNKKKHYLVGFAAETENIIKNAREKLIKKNADMIIANSLNVAGNDETEVYIVKKNTKEQKINGDKFFVSHKILDEIVNDIS
jgi:phosphopantothenoylcysteine decarboxylase/phosphopantothenate--cysteine ligase